MLASPLPASTPQPFSPLREKVARVSGSDEGSAPSGNVTPSPASLREAPSPAEGGEGLAQPRALSHASIVPISASRAPSWLTDSMAAPRKAWTSRLSASGFGRPRCIR